MGSIGAPGFGFGWAPAISFNSDHEDCISNAYVTPIPEVKRETCNETDWNESVGDVVCLWLIVSLIQTPT